MPMKKKNKGAEKPNGKFNAEWFNKRVNRQRKRNKIAKQSRKRNR